MVQTFQMRRFAAFLCVILLENEYQAFLDVWSEQNQQSSAVSLVSDNLLLHLTFC